MSAAHLPEDIRRWPRDPYQVLGVAHRCDPREARKAYTGLIRQFKPEQFPEHFRLIREAYDAVKLQARFEFPSESPVAQSPVESPVADSPGSPASGDSLQILWDMACNGREEEAYCRLREMHDINPHGSELPARLYSLLLANPELDPMRTPCDWLVRGVRSEGPWGPCRQLYRREIDDRPEEAMHQRFMRLLDDAAASRMVVDFLSMRWEALARMDKTEWISEDLNRVAPRMERIDEEGWVRVLLRAADFLAWQRNQGFAGLCQEIEGHVHVHAALGEDLSRLDFLRDLARSWHKQGGKTATMPLLKVLPQTWTNPFENRHRVLAQCRAVAEKPEHALADLDEVSRQAPLIAAHLGQTLYWLWPAPAEPRDESTLLSVIGDHLGGLSYPVGAPDYAIYRRRLLRLCLSEMVAPETVASTLDPKLAAFAIQLIHDDWPLRTVCLAHQLIWA